MKEKLWTGVVELPMRFRVQLHYNDPVCTVRRLWDTLPDRRKDKSLSLAAYTILHRTSLVGAKIR